MWCGSGYMTWSAWTRWLSVRLLVVVIVVMIRLDAVILDMALSQLVLALMQVRRNVVVVTVRLHVVW